ncbi:Glycosyltransferase [Halalkaliarchaeum sp. AArc-CO]|uniref:glycosyltransferase family 4 protein n=1 Tax=Halalkaliarchaeum sp. AArc-CO TaxID=2866381 RepID=UPI00217DC016|nr:glycosyltransferase family 4 protein [Halalkaliarchaeum sp. AArc-CO]UWG52011.1 Glycosyltransferase [Halalkaliarchaeum sp. AArc-CO]
MTRPLRVVFFHIHTGEEYYGGAPKMLFRLLSSLDSDRFAPVLLSPNEGYLCKQVRKLNIDVKIVPFKGALDTYRQGLLSDPKIMIPALFRMLQYNFEARKCLQSADIIWCQNLRAVLTVFPHLQVSQTPTIWNIGLGLNSEGTIRYLHRVALATVDYVFIESEEQANRIFDSDVHEQYREKFTVFHKGIDVSKFDPSRLSDPTNTDEFRIGTAVSLTPRKGIEYLIDAVPDLVEENENVKVLIAGQTPKEDETYADKLRNQVKETGIEEYVEFLGWVDEMPEYLNTLDVFVLPSLNEGIPGAVREALAMEVPVIATNVGGTPEVVIHKSTGLLIEPKDSEQIVESVIFFMRNPSEADRMAREGRKHVVDSFSMENYVQKYEEFLSEVGNETKSPNGE